MNQSFDASSNNYHLPRITQNDSTYLRATNKLSSDMRRSASYSQGPKGEKVSITRKLVLMQDIKNAEEYENMNEKDLLREHEKLLRVLKKFQQIIDINLQKKQKEREKLNSNKPQTSRQQIFIGQISNNKKIIENYNKQLKQLEGLKKCRKLHEVIEEKSKVQGQINRLKKELFTLKNQDNMAGRSLVADRGIIQKQLKQHEKDLKIQLIKKQEYQQKLQSLQSHLVELKKECEGLNITDISNQKSNNQNIAQKIAIKKQQLDEVTKMYVNYEESIQQNMVAKAKRNKNVAKQIDNCERRIVQLNHKIQKYKQKISNYQQAMQIGPKGGKNQ